MTEVGPERGSPAPPARSGWADWSYWRDRARDLFSRREPGAKGLPWLAGAVALAVLFVSMAALMGARQLHQPAFNKIDEGAHFDYVVYLSEGRIPRWGDLYQPETLRLGHCLSSPPGQACQVNPDPRRMAPQGYSYEAQQPPLAYLVYLPFLDTHGSPIAVLDRVRDGGVVWLVIGGALLVAMAWLADLSLLQTAVVLGVCNFDPTYIRATAIVSNDSAAVAAGAASVVVVQLARRHPRRMLVPCFVVGVLIGLMKTTFLTVPLAILLGGLLTERPRREGFRLADAWRRRRAEILVLAGAVLSTVAFMLYQDARAVVPSRTVLRALFASFKIVPRPTWTTIELSIQNIFSTFIGGPSPSLANIDNVLVFGSVIGLALNQTVRGRRGGQALAMGTLIASVAMAVAFALFTWAQAHIDGATSVRYGIVVLPLLGYLAARSLRPAGLYILGVVMPVAVLITAHYAHGL